MPWKSKETMRRPMVEGRTKRVPLMRRMSHDVRSSRSRRRLRHSLDDDSQTQGIGVHGESSVALHEQKFVDGAGDDAELEGFHQGVELSVEATAHPRIRKPFEAAAVASDVGGVQHELVVTEEADLERSHGICEGGELVLADDVE